MPADKPVKAFRLRLPDWWPALAVALVALATWEFIPKDEGSAWMFFPVPSRIAAALGSAAMAKGEKSLFFHMGWTLKRLFEGLLIGGSAGLLLGMLMGSSGRLGRALDPIIAALHPIPKISILPLALVIFGLGDTSIIALVSVAAFFPMLINTMTGVRQIHPIHFEVARNYGAGWLDTFRHVTAPGSLPMILAGMRLAINIALTVAIAVEFRTSGKGIGALTWRAWEIMRVEQLYVGLVATAAIGVVSNLVLKMLSARVAQWQPEHEVYK